MMTNIDYSRARDWILGEKVFDSSNLGKCEAIMCLGNGYLGLRSATEEKYLFEKRNLFIAGTFNQFDKTEVTELPNSADLIGMELLINNCRFYLDAGKVKEYYREINFKNGELKRTISWVSPKGEEINFVFSRIVSMERLHIVAQKVEIESVTGDVNIELTAGIDGQQTNSGSQHFTEGNKRLFDGEYMQYAAKTTKSDIEFLFNTALKFFVKNNSIKPKFRIAMERRKIYSKYQMELKVGDRLIIEKISNVHTSRDKENEKLSYEEIKEKSLVDIKAAVRAGYDMLAKESALAWDKKVWSSVPVTIHSMNPRDQLALRFAQYHLYVMTPAHDNRMNIGAKGLSGEGYKGHTFWDTDIFALPYFTFTDPQIARSLEEYRYLSLPGAHEKARTNQYEGAQFPWESAWLDDGEVTPVWGAADVITGLPTKIWSGFIEQHITSDVAYGVWQYYQVTGDQDFMDKFGYELILDTAKFWSSRLEWDENGEMYHINDVVGPDEYKEHVNDNAFTNYMAHWNIKMAMKYYVLLKDEKPEIFTSLNEKLGLDKVYEQWLLRADKIYLPQPREKDLVIPQHSTYLTLKDIDLSKYKNQTHVGSMFHDYNLEQVNQMQVTKQADVMILFFLMEDLFSLEVKKSNWDYYEARSLHDSSLSLSTHCILASDMGEKELAYQLFKKACNIDMGENMKTFDEGIHGAAIAGIWQSAVFGFGGVRMLGGKLRICPHLPDAWSGLMFSVYWKGQKLQIDICKDKITIENLTKEKKVDVQVYEAWYQIDDKIVIE